MTLNIKPDVVVDNDYYWLPLHHCPLGRKVLLLTDGDVAILGIYKPGMTGAKAWCPLPKKPEWLRSQKAS